jgi:hypothetical protein
VIPDTALGLILTVAALGPGYIYLRVAERRSRRPERSGLLEAVELAVIGALASTVALLIVGALADWFGIANVHWLGAHPAVYAGHHPLRLLWLVSAALALAYLIAYVAAIVAHHGKPDAIRPAGSAWTEAFMSERPKTTATVLTVELRDGRRVEGTLQAHTPNPDDNRELYLIAPIRVQAGPRSTPVRLAESFVVLRETDILAISGRYKAGKSVATDSNEMSDRSGCGEGSGASSASAGDSQPLAADGEAARRMPAEAER